MDITYQGKNYFIQKNEEENEKSLFNRMMFIAKQEPQNDNELKKETRFANMWVNQKLLNCEYSDKIKSIIDQKTNKL